MLYNLLDILQDNKLYSVTGIINELKRLLCFRSRLQ